MEIDSHRFKHKKVTMVFFIRLYKRCFDVLIDKVPLKSKKSHQLYDNFDFDVAPDWLSLSFFHIKLDGVQ